jgi:hypothetical protein
MDALDGSVGRLMQNVDTTRVVASFAALAVLYYLGRIVYNVYFGPLASIPGPKARAWSNIPFARTMWRGEDGMEYPGWWIQHPLAREVY